MLEVIMEIIRLEWDQFQRVENEGGRASCQDDYETFEIMRKSQFMAWDEELIRSYFDDIMAAESQGRNLITEKYARMMASTDPEGYERIKDFLPEVSEEKRGLVEEAVTFNVTGEEEFLVRHPKFGDRTRRTHTSEDDLYNTSMETYARGELLTYSLDTMKRYVDMCRRMEQDGESLAEKTHLNMCRLYGYASIEEAEESMME